MDFRSSFWLILSGLAHSGYAQPTPKTHEIQLRFAYPGRDGALPMVATVDEKRDEAMAKSCGNGSSTTCLNDAEYFALGGKISDPQVLKNNFLQKLEKSIPEGATVRFDASAHGLLGTDGKWYLQLPHRQNLPDSLFVGGTEAKPGEEIQGGLKVNGKGRTMLMVNTKDPAFAGRFVSMEEIGEVLKRRGVTNVYGALGICHSGGSSCSLPALEKLGIRASFLAGAPRDRAMTGYASSGSLMSDFLNQVRRNPEKYDLDKDRRITWGEVLKASEDFRRTEVQKRTSSMGNQVSQDRGFQPTVVGDSSAVENQVVFDFTKGLKVNEKAFPNGTHFE